MTREPLDGLARRSWEWFHRFPPIGGGNREPLTPTGSPVPVGTSREPVIQSPTKEETSTMSTDTHESTEAEKLVTVGARHSDCATGS